jgi:hypothetical protein
VLELWVASLGRDYELLVRACSSSFLLCVAFDEIVLALACSCELSSVNASSLSMEHCQQILATNARANSLLAGFASGATMSVEDWRLNRS